jgi:hypothetical protein
VRHAPITAKTRQTLQIMTERKCTDSGSVDIKHRRARLSKRVFNRRDQFKLDCLRQLLLRFQRFDHPPNERLQAE